MQRLPIGFFWGPSCSAGQGHIVAFFGSEDITKNLDVMGEKMDILGATLDRYSSERRQALRALHSGFARGEGQTEQTAGEAIFVSGQTPQEAPDRQK